MHEVMLSAAVFEMMMTMKTTSCFLISSLMFLAQ